MSARQGHWCTDVVLSYLAVSTVSTVGDVADKCDVEPKAAQRCLDVLRRRGLAERPSTGVYRITSEGRAALAKGRKIRSGPAGRHTGPRTPRRNSFQSRVWKALRATRKATLGDLVQLAANGDEKDPVANARAYVKALVRAGYAVELGREPGTAPQSNGFKRYLLTTDPGPEAPIFNVRKRSLRDPNSGTTIDLSGERP